jgi:RNA polymerase sigma-70 factor (ECF subfamily)
MNAGDADQVVKSLYTECYSPLVNYALRARLNTANTAEDAVQEAFLALYAELVHGGPVHSPKGWTFCVLRRQIIKFRRQELKHRDLCSSIRHLSSAHPAEYREIEIDGLLSVLTRREAEILQMREKPMRYAAIAAALGISVNTVKTLLSRAIRKLQEAVRQSHSDCLAVRR